MTVSYFYAFGKYLRRKQELYILIVCKMVLFEPYLSATFDMLSGQMLSCEKDV